MQTRYWNSGSPHEPSDRDISEAAALLKEGKVVAFPTETVYGLGGDAGSDEAIERIFQAKGRPADNPLIVHIADVGQLHAIVDLGGLGDKSEREKLSEIDSQANLGEVIHADEAGDSTKERRGRWEGQDSQGGSKKYLESSEFLESTECQEGRAGYQDILCGTANRGRTTSGEAIQCVIQQLIEQFWPGPLTLVLPVRPGAVSAKVTAGLSTVAVRMPKHPVALKLIRAAGRPIAAPSANRSGRPSPTTAAHVREDLDGLIEGILDGGPCRFGVESTVVEVSADGGLTILRPGSVTQEQLKTAVRHVGITVSVDPMIEIVTDDHVFALSDQVADGTMDSSSDGMKDEQVAAKSDKMVDVDMLARTDKMSGVDVSTESDQVADPDVSSRLDKVTGVGVSADSDKLAGVGASADSDQVTGMDMTSDSDQVTEVQMAAETRKRSGMLTDAGIKGEKQISTVETWGHAEETQTGYPKKLMRHDKVQLLSNAPSPRSPGMKYAHYAPFGHMIVVSGSDRHVVQQYIERQLTEAKRRGEKTGALVFSEHAAHYTAHADILLAYGSIHEPVASAQSIYGALREFDRRGATFIVAEGWAMDGIGAAVMNRLHKAASGRLIRLD